MENLTIDKSETSSVAVVEIVQDPPPPPPGTLGQRAGVDTLANGTKVFMIRDGPLQIAAYESMGLALFCTMFLPLSPSAALISGAFFVSVFQKPKLRVNMFKLLGAATMYIGQTMSNLVTVHVPQTVVMTGNVVVPIVKGTYAYAVRPSIKLLNAHIATPAIDYTWNQITADLITPSGSIAKIIVLPANLVFKGIKMVSIPAVTYVLLTDPKAREAIMDIGSNVIDVTKTSIGIVSDTVESVKHGADLLRQSGAVQTSLAISSVVTIIYYVYTMTNGKAVGAQAPNARVETKKRKRKSK